MGGNKNLRGVDFAIETDKQVLIRLHFLGIP